MCNSGLVTTTPRRYFFVFCHCQLRTYSLSLLSIEQFFWSIIYLIISLKNQTQVLNTQPNCPFSNIHQTTFYLGSYYFILTWFAGQSAVDLSHCTPYLVTKCLVYDKYIYSYIYLINKYTFWRQNVTTLQTIMKYAQVIHFFKEVARLA